MDSDRPWLPSHVLPSRYTPRIALEHFIVALLAANFHFVEPRVRQRLRGVLYYSLFGKGATERAGPKRAPRSAGKAAAATLPVLFSDKHWIGVNGCWFFTLCVAIALPIRLGFWGPWGLTAAIVCAYHPIVMWRFSWDMRRAGPVFRTAFRIVFTGVLVVGYPWYKETFMAELRKPDTTWRRLILDGCVTIPSTFLMMGAAFRFEISEIVCMFLCLTFIELSGAITAMSTLDSGNCTPLTCVLIIASRTLLLWGYRYWLNRPVNLPGQRRVATQRGGAVTAERGGGGGGGGGTTGPAGAYAAVVRFCSFQRTQSWFSIFVFTSFTAMLAATHISGVIAGRMAELYIPMRRNPVDNEVGNDQPWLTLLVLVYIVCAAEYQNYVYKRTSSAGRKLDTTRTWNCFAYGIVVGGMCIAARVLRSRTDLVDPEWWYQTLCVPAVAIASTAAVGAALPRGSTGHRFILAALVDVVPVGGSVLMLPFSHWTRGNAFIIHRVNVITHSLDYADQTCAVALCMFLMHQSVGKRVWQTFLQLVLSLSFFLCVALGHVSEAIILSVATFHAVILTLCVLRHQKRRGKWHHRQSATTVYAYAENWKMV